MSEAERLRGIEAELDARCAPKPRPTRAELVLALKGKGCDTHLTIRAPYPAHFAAGLGSCKSA